MVYAYIWKYQVKIEHEKEFIDAYGQNGEWVQFFKSSPHYIKTELFEDRDRNSIYFTIDYWENYDAFKNFKKSNQELYYQIDLKYEKFIESEVCISDNLNLIGRYP